MHPDLDKDKGCQYTDPLNESLVRSFFSSSHILLTGATGYLGKLILNQLLVKCVKYDRYPIIHLVIRNKNNLTANERFEELKTHEIFNLLNKYDDVNKKKGKKSIYENIRIVSFDLRNLKTRDEYVMSSPEVGGGELMSSRSEPWLKSVIKNENELNNNSLLKHIELYSIELIIHAAAETACGSFRQNLLINCLVYENLLKLSKRMNSLKSIVHFTSLISLKLFRSLMDEKKFSNNPQSDEKKDMDEKGNEELLLSATFLPVKRLTGILNWMSNEMLDRMGKSYIMKLLGSKKTSCYHMSDLMHHITKWFSEQYLYHHLNSSDVNERSVKHVLIRLPTLGSTIQEPYDGYIEKFNRPSQLIIATGRGFLRSMVSNCERKIDIHNILMDVTPADIVANLTLVSLYYVDKRSEELEDGRPFILQSTIGNKNPFLWNNLDMVTRITKKIPLEHAFRRPNMSTSSSAPQMFGQRPSFIISCIIPAVLHDMWQAARRRPANAISTYQDIYPNMLTMFDAHEFIVSPFTTLASFYASMIRRLIWNMLHLTNEQCDEKKKKANNTGNANTGTTGTPNESGTNSNDHFEEMENDIELNESFTSNHLKIIRTLSDIDQCFYNIQVTDKFVTKESFLSSYVIATKVCLLHEKMGDIPNARRHLRNLQIIRWCSNLILAVFIWRYFIAKSSLAVNSWYFIMNLVVKFVRFFKLTATIQNQ
ncbi:hypothetical protein SNEBB_011501 [Seison nebaliae]|nr:hypothetical protein SNEBB_011501 [Seison nebaliae]